MRFLISFVGLLGISSCLAWSHPEQVQDTPEVAAAKAAHLAALAKAKEKAREKARYTQEDAWNEGTNSLKEDHQEAWKNGWKDDGTSGDGAQDLGSQNDDGSWKGDDSWKNYDDGSWEEDDQTTEKPKVERRWDGNQRWTGPVALPPGYDETGAPLPVEDTPEVAAAKAKHLLLYAKAVSRSRSAAPQAPSAAQIQQNRQQHRNNAILPVKPKVRPPPGRSAPPPHLPAPVWENGEVQDTPEVAAAKAAHYAAHARRRA